jgi:hypothetical protein
MTLDLDDIIDEIKAERLQRATSNPIRIIGVETSTKSWFDFYERFWATDDGQEFLRWCAERRMNQSTVSL